MKKLAYQCAFLLSIGLCIVVCLAPAVLATNLDSRLQSVLAVAGAADAIPVIATFHNGVEFSRLPAGPRHLRRAELVRTLKGRAAAAQAPAREFLRGRGAGPIKDLWIINGLAVTVSPETILALAARPEVASIRYDEVISLPRISPTLVTGPAEPNINQVNAPALWALGFAGQGVTVATMDSGVDLNHPDLGPRWRGGSNSWFNPIASRCNLPGANCTTCEQSVLIPCDELNSVDVAHGTGVMGVLVGGNTGGNYIGVAPESEWIAVKIFDSNSNAESSDIHAGFQWLLDPDGNPATDDAPDVVNNSWGFENSANQCITEFQPDIQRLKDAEIAVVFSAGNQGALGSNSSVSPANNTNAFAVGSVNVSTTPTISIFSSRGPSPCDSPGVVFPEVVAPGEPILTADYTFGGLFPNSFIALRGTSLAAPHVSGVMALLLSAFPETSVETLETVLKTSATDLGPGGIPDNSYGYGLVNAQTAFNQLNDALLGIVDQLPPSDDGILPFGSVPVGSTATSTITLRNDGSGVLFIESVSVAESPTPFSITDNTCTQGLPPGASCAVAVRFAPAAHQSFAARLDVFSNSSAGGVTSLELTGTGNTPPPAPQPVAPADGATGLATTVMLQWDQMPDVDGDPVSNEVFFSMSVDFSQSTPIEVTSRTAAGGKALLAGVGGFLMLFGIADGNRKRRWQVLAGGLLVTALLLLFSCGGGGGGGGGDPVAGEVRSLELSGLAPATTYFWKVAAVDSLGDRTEGPVRSFTTR